MDAQGKSESDSARRELLDSAKTSKIKHVQRATTQAQEASRGSGARENSRPTRSAADASESGNSGSLAQPRSARNPNVGAILRRALLLLRRKGWRPGHWERGSVRGVSVFEAIQRAGGAAADCYYAKLTLTAVLGFPFADWEAGAWRSEEEVFALLRRAAVVARGDAFAARGGGWRVSSGAPRAAASNVSSINQKRRAV